MKNLSRIAHGSKILAHARTAEGGFYRHVLDGHYVMFIRPISRFMVRVKDLSAGGHVNVRVADLAFLNELETLAAQCLNPDEARQQGSDRQSSE